MDQFSSLLTYYTALIESDLPEVEKWSAGIGVNVRFSHGMLNSITMQHNAMFFYENRRHIAAKVAYSSTI